MPSWHVRRHKLFLDLLYCNVINRRYEKKGLMNMLLTGTEKHPP